MISTTTTGLQLVAVRRQSILIVVQRFASAASKLGKDILIGVAHLLVQTQVHLVTHRAILAAIAMPSFAGSQDLGQHGSEPVDDSKLLFA
jgi:hypothetical protein